MLGARFRKLSVCIALTANSIRSSIGSLFFHGMPRFYLTTPPKSVTYVLNLLCYLWSEPAARKIVSCELAAPQSLSLGKTVPTELVASAISLNLEDIVTDTHHPQICSVGLPFEFTELRHRAPLERARVNISGFDALRDLGVNPQLHLYTRVSDGFDIRARMFAPLSGVPEDPATGSANCTLGGLLAHHKEESSGTFSWRIAQGVEMGRPSTLIARAEKKSGVVTGTWIGGATVLVSEGSLHLD